jgi:hypothetical protein
MAKDTKITDLEEGKKEAPSCYSPSVDAETLDDEDDTIVYLESLPSDHPFATIEHLPHRFYSDGLIYEMKEPRMLTMDEMFVDLVYVSVIGAIGKNTSMSIYSLIATFDLPTYFFRQYYQKSDSVQHDPGYRKLLCGIHSGMAVSILDLDD